LHKLVLPWVVRKYVGAVLSTEAFKWTVVLALQVKVPTTSAMDSSPNSVVGEEGWKTDLGAAGARSLHPVAARI
jgi:hypothetical protein